MRKILLIITLIFCVSTAYAGDFGLSFGPKFGYQTATLSLKKADIENSFKNSWTAGLFVRVRFGHFVIQPELMYFKSEEIISISGLQSQDPNPSIKLNQQNLALPVFLGFQLGKEFFRARFNVGPVMYFVVKQENSISLEDAIQDISKELEKIKAQNTLGAAANVGIDLWRFTLDVSYSFGLTNIFNTENLNLFGASIPLSNSKQNIFMLTLGFRIFD